MPQFGTAQCVYIEVNLINRGTKLLKNYILDILHTLHQKPMDSTKIFMLNGKSPRKPFVLMKPTTIHPPPHNASSALRLRCNGLIDGLAGGLPLLAAGVAWIGTCQWIFVEDLLRENGG